MTSGYTDNRSKEPPSQGLSIAIEKISKRYGHGAKGKWALRDLTCTIEPGVFGLLGRNGAGKTTLLQILATLLEPTEGKLQIGPYDGVQMRWHVRPLLGFLPQDQGFYPKLTVRETLNYMAMLQGLKQPRLHIERVIEAVNLTDRLHTRVSALSGGMRRRLGLAQALLGDPPIVIVDEPTAGLDPVEQQRFRTLLGTLGAQGNRTILLSTHIIGDVATVANSLAVLEQGRLVFRGTVNTLTEQARGRCWQWRTNINLLEEMSQNNHLLISSVTPTTDASAAPDQVIARIVGNRPSSDAVACEPTLEDGYFLLIGASEYKAEIPQARIGRKQ